MARLCLTALRHMHNFNKNHNIVQDHMSNKEGKKKIDGASQAGLKRGRRLANGLPSRMRGGEETNTHEAFLARKAKQEKKAAAEAAVAAAAAAAQQQQQAADDEAAAAAAQAAAAAEAMEAAATALELQRAAAVAATGAQDDKEEATAGEDEELAAVESDDDEEKAAAKLEATVTSILAMGRVPKRRAEVAVEHKRRVVEVTQVEEPTPRRRTATTTSTKGVKKMTESTKQLKKEETRGQRMVDAVRRELQYGGQ